MTVRNVGLIASLLCALTANADPPPNANPVALHATGATQFADYSLPPSASGILDHRNVIVLAPSEGDCYVARVSFTNTEGVEIETPSGPVTPERIFVWQMVCGGPSNPSYVLEYIYPLSAAGFDQAYGAQIREDWDGDGMFDRDETYGYRFTLKSDALAASELIHGTESYLDESGAHISDGNWTQHIASLGEPLAVNGMVFDDVAVVHFLGFGRIRFRARGIGVVREVSGNMNSDAFFLDQSSRDVIFYRVDGTDPGTSLAETPFPGLLSAPWFQAP